MKYLSAILLLAVAAVLTANPAPPAAAPGQASAPGLASAPGQAKNQTGPPTEEDYKKIVDAAQKKCNPDDKELINLQNKNFNSTKVETWCFAKELCMQTKHCLSNGDLDPTPLMAQQTSEDDKKAVKNTVDECVKQNKDVKDVNQKTYKQLACMLGNAKN